MTTGVAAAAYDLPPEECIVLLCSYIDSLILAASSSLPPPQSQETPQQTRPLPTPPQDSNDIDHNHLEHTINTPNSECPSTPRTPRRSLDYVAERPNGTVTRVLGGEFGIGVKYGELDSMYQKQRLALRFTSKEVPKISIFDYLERYRSPIPPTFSPPFTLLLALWRVAVVCPESEGLTGEDTEV